ncbi:MAG: DUF1499 domain-containing protein [Betaproteobacteria bacterium]|jgi:uncharacterized protein (DUF1499 family)|nr:MAG: DUF1499 domain-containing protein [Betaproteobacteria bacterium]
MPLLSLRGRASSLGLTDSGLSACPSSPNCVCSDESGTAQTIEPLRLSIAAEDAWPLVQQTVRNLPRTRMVSNTSDYIHAECASSLFGFVDDLELNLRPDDRIIAVRSASRLGYYDFGANRRRVETLRTALRERNVVR